MALEQTKPPRARHKFGFSGRTRRTPQNLSSVDDVLESLKRRAQLSDRLQEDAKAVLEVEDPPQAVSFELPSTTLKHAGRRALSKFAFFFMLVGGVLILWAQGALGSFTDPSTIDKVVESPVYPAIFSDPGRLLAVAAICFVPFFLLRRRHNSQDKLMYG